MESPTPEKKGGQPPATPEGEPKRSPSVGPMIVMLMLGGLIAFWLWRSSPTNSGTKVPASVFYKQLADDNVKTVHFMNHVITGEWKHALKPAPPGQKDSDLKFHTVLPPANVPDDHLLPLLREKGVTYDSEDTSVGMGTQLMFWLIGPMLLLGFLWFMMRRSSDPMGSGMMNSFIKSPAKRFQPAEQQSTFDEVAGMEQAKSELQEVVEFLKTPDKFQRLGARIPKGVLLMGTPGTGKTLLARATAGEAGVPFFAINGSEFIQMFVGVGASRVRDLFRTAKDNAPCIIFVDEIDAVGRVRGAGVGGGHDEREQTLNQILSEMDGFEESESVIVLAATNRPDVLDPALLRPGRFDRHISVEKPNRKGRMGILKVHSRKVPLADEVDLDQIAGGTIGFSGADLRNLVNEAALCATRAGKQEVESEDFESARDRVLMGAERDDIMNEHERGMTAYHEAGHAIIAWLLPDVDRVHKVTIIPRGRALGVTQLLPDEERYNVGEKRLHAQLQMALGGRAAEKLVFDEYSAGAEDDINRATQMARKMVAHWGMSSVIGPVALRQGEDHPFLGKEMHEQRKFSESTARTIDREVQRFLMQAATAATELLTEHRGQLDDLAESLLQRESLDKTDLRDILGEEAQRSLKAESNPVPHDE